jgi:Ca-activated chloride channel family protein
MTAPIAIRPTGLCTRTDQAPIPLERVDVSAVVVDVAATVTVKQRYRNVEQVPLEVVYVFPLDEGAAVCGFEAVVDGARYVGEVREREQAFRDYDDALEAGHGGFLLDEERADVFTASLGNLKPGSTVELTLTYVTELATEGTAARFSLPTTVSPRYAPAEHHAGVGRTEAEALNPPVDLHVPYRFTFDMHVAAAGTITRIESASHPVTTEITGSAARVSLTQRDAAMDRDLIVVFEAAGMAAPHATTERGEHGAAVLVSFLPEFAATSQPAEVVFVIDRSGSMSGSSIEEVRNALHLCLRSLSSGCRFDIVSFGSHFASLFPESRAYGDDSLADASAHVGNLEADMGGTEILPALEFVLNRPRHAGLPLQVVLLTDGEVTNTDEVIALARRHAATARVFTFGIGAGASHHLVRAVARATGGAAEFIAPGERIEAKVLRQFRRVLAPALLDVQITWPGGGLVQAPAMVPPVFAGERLRVYALGDSLPPGTVTLTGTLSGQEFRSDVPLDSATRVTGSTVTRLAARARIRDLEEQPEYLAARGSLQPRTRLTRGTTEEIVALGVRYQLCSRETSFVAIEHRDVPVKDRAQLRKVPVMLTHGWGGSDRAPAGQVLLAARTMAGAAMNFDACMSPAASFMASPAPPPAAPAKRAFYKRLRGVSAEAVAQASARLSPAAPPAPSRSARTHDALIRLQRADGSWELDRSLARLVGREFDRLKQALAGSRGNLTEAASALATALALTWLEHHAADSREEWEMVFEKGVAWLRHCKATPPAGAASWTAVAEAQF